jgi:shikimate kinase
MAKSSPKKPLTQRERQAKKKRAVESEKVTMQNICKTKQMVILNIKPPAGGDFFVHSRNVNLMYNKTVTLPLNRLWPSQLSRLQKNGMITVVYESAKEAARQKLLENKSKREEKVAAKAKAAKAKASKAKAVKKSSKKVSSSKKPSSSKSEPEATSDSSTEDSEDK